MNNLIPLGGSMELPEPPAKKPGRKRARKEADASGLELGLVRWNPEDIEAISKLGCHIEYTGVTNTARGVFHVTLDEAKQQLDSVKSKIAALEGLETSENSFERMALLRLQNDAIKLIASIGHSIMKSRPEEVATITETKSVKSFPASGTIPAMEVTQTTVAKEQG